MQIAILATSSMAFACSAGTLFFAWRISRHLEETTAHLKNEVEEAKNKLSTNGRIVKAAIDSLEV